MPAKPVGPSSAGGGNAIAGYPCGDCPNRRPGGSADHRYSQNSGGTDGDSQDWLPFLFLRPGRVKLPTSLRRTLATKPFHGQSRHHRCQPSRARGRTVGKLYLSGLIDFDDIAYDDHADLLYDLAKQVVNHFRQLSRTEEEIHRILRVHQRDIARFVHVQMQPHFWEEATDYRVNISRGFTNLKQCAYTTTETTCLDYRHPPADKNNMRKYLFGGFSRCLYAVQKFDTNTERMLAVILEREALKWFRPAKGQFQIYYRWNGEQTEYQPDFVAETDQAIYMLEPKMSSQITAPQVLAKKTVALTWCQQATTYIQSHGGKPWRYSLIPHDAIAENMTLQGLLDQYP